MQYSGIILLKTMPKAQVDKFTAMSAWPDQSTRDV